MSDRPRILVIEDDPLVLMMMILDLQADAFDAAGADTEREAADKIAASVDLDAIVIDLDLRRGDGYALARTARALNPALVVIYTSGVAQPDFGTCRVAESVLMAKPALAQELPRLLRSLLM